MEPTCSSRELHAPTCAILDEENLEPQNDMSLTPNATSMLECDSEPIIKARMSSISNLAGGKFSPCSLVPERRVSLMKSLSYCRQVLEEDEDSSAEIRLSAAAPMALILYSHRCLTVPIPCSSGSTQPTILILSAYRYAEECGNAWPPSKNSAESHAHFPHSNISSSN